MLLPSAATEIDDKAVTAVLMAAGVSADSARRKQLVASLVGIDIAEAMATAVAAPAAAAPVAAAASADAAPAEEAEEEEEEEGGFEGLGSLFG